MLVRRPEKAYQPMSILNYHSCLWLGLAGPNSISSDFWGLGILTNPFLTWDLGVDSSFIDLTWTEWGMKPWMSQTPGHTRGDNMRSLSGYCWKHRRNPKPRLSYSIYQCYNQTFKYRLLFWNQKPKWILASITHFLLRWFIIAPRSNKYNIPPSVGSKAGHSYHLSPGPTNHYC